MTGFSPKEKLTAYQRWEIAAFDESQNTGPGNIRRPPPPPAPDKSAPSEPAVALPTATEVEEIYAEAQRQGYEAGYAEGQRDGLAQAAQITALLSNLDQALTDLDQKIADQLLALALEIANQTLRQSLRVKPELLIPVVREAISILNPHAGHPTLFANPSDIALIKAQLGEHLAHNNWRILEDEAITPGGCRVELGASEVDATLETRWRRVIESIGTSQDWLDAQS